MSPNQLEERHRKQFPKWFKGHVKALYDQKSVLVTEELYALAQGPSRRCVQHTGCIVNGVRWRIKQIDQNKTTQNSGVMTMGSHEDEACTYYGKLVNVVKVQFQDAFKVILFNCEWYDTENKNNRVKRDYHLTSVDINSRWYIDDPYVLAIEAHQVFYLDDPKLGDPWKVVQRIQPRHVWDVPEKEDIEDDRSSANIDENMEYDDGDTNMEGEVQVENDEIDTSLVRNDVEPETIIVDASSRSLLFGIDNDNDFIDGEDVNWDDELSSNENEDAVCSEPDSDLE